MSIILYILWHYIGRKNIPALFLLGIQPTHTLLLTSYPQNVLKMGYGLHVFPCLTSHLHVGFILCTLLYFRRTILLREYTNNDLTCQRNCDQKERCVNIFMWLKTVMISTAISLQQKEWKGFM